MLKLKLDPKDVLEVCKSEQEKVKKELSKSVRDLANATKQHIIELAQKKLSPSLQLVFRGKDNEQNLRVDHLDSNTSVVTLSGSAYWIEEGIPPNTDMKTDAWLFSSKSTKHGKNGRYLVIPFEHSKKPSLQTGYEKGLTDRVRFELKAMNKRRKANGLETVPWAGVERDKNGNPKEGLLHEFDFKGGKSSHKWSSDPLERMRIYQAIDKDSAGNAKLNKKGKVKVTRSFMTFRTASESPIVNPETGVAPKDKFIHPGYKANKFMEEAMMWAENEFYTRIIPDIISKWKD